MEAIITSFDDGTRGFVQYTIDVSWREGSTQVVKRFTDFQQLHDAIRRSYPGFSGSLPPKRWFGRFNPDFLRERRRLLQDYLDQALALPGLLSLNEARLFFELEDHGGHDLYASDKDPLNGGSGTYGREAALQARVNSIVDEATRLLINISLPLHQISIEQMDQTDLGSQRLRLLNRVKGLQGHAAGVQGVFSELIVSGCPWDGALDSLPLPLQLVEKHGLAVADSLREASQLRARDDDLVCHWGD